MILVAAKVIHFPIKESEQYQLSGRLGQLTTTSLLTSLYFKFNAGQGLVVTPGTQRLLKAARITILVSVFLDLGVDS